MPHQGLLSICVPRCSSRLVHLKPRFLGSNKTTSSLTTGFRCALCCKASCLFKICVLVNRVVGEGGGKGSSNGGRAEATKRIRRGKRKRITGKATRKETMLCSEGTGEGKGLCSAGVQNVAKRKSLRIMRPRRTSLSTASPRDSNLNQGTSNGYTVSVGTTGNCYNHRRAQRDTDP